MKTGTELESSFEALCRSHGEGCPRCDHGKHYSLKDGRRRCAACRHTFHPMSGRFIRRTKLSLQDWQLMVRFFADGLTVQEAAKDLGVSEVTAQKAFSSIRLAALSSFVDDQEIFSEQGELVDFCPNLHSEIETDLCKGCRSYVFGLNLPASGPARLRLARGLKAREVLAAPVTKKNWRNFIHTDRFGDFDALFFSCCKRGREVFASGFTDEPTWLDEQATFRAHTDGWLARYRAFKPTSYPLYLAEAVLRYNHAEQDMANEIERLICGFVPKPRDKSFSSVR